MDLKGATLRITGWIVATAATLTTLSCMTPERAVRESDASAIALATTFWQKQTGLTNSFDVHRPSDALALRVALLASAKGDEPVVFPKIQGEALNISTNGELVLTLRDALSIGARNDRTYQNHKEAVFNRALDLDWQQYQFDTTFTGLLLGALDGDMPAHQATGKAQGGVAKKFKQGAEIAGKLALDVASLLRDDWRSYGFAGDLTMTVPLLRGAGKEVVTEPLTQAERELAYALRTFERYRQTYAVSIASGFYTVLRYEQQMYNAMENARRLELNAQRAEMMFKAGRMQRIQVDQAKTDLLNANESVVSTRQTWENQLDAFKILLGLPPEGRVALEREELRALEKEMKEKADNTKDALEGFPDEFESCKIAMESRGDLLTVLGRYEDEARGVRIAADALLPELNIAGGVDLNRRRSSGQNKFRGAESWDAKMQFDFPWNRRRERNAFRRQLIELERAKRDLEEKEDVVKQDVRRARRALVAARLSYDINVEATKVAELRVKSNDLFMQSGRSSMRDILEAESALLSARNAMVGAVITWKLGDWQLRRDMGILSFDGTIHFSK